MVLAAESGTAKRPPPSGWRSVRLGEVAEYLNGRAFKPEEWGKSGLPIIRIENLNSPTALFNYFEGRVDPRNLVNDGDLLISWSASLDAYKWCGGPAVLNQHIFRVAEKRELITREYLYFATRQAMREIRLRVHGATMRHITKPEFEAIQIPLPPLEEQKRIAAILNEQMAAVERARAAAEAKLEAAKTLPAAYLSAVFSSPEGQQWPRKSLSEISQIAGGIQKTPDRAPVNFHRPYLTVRNVQRGFLDLSQIERFEVTPDEVSRLCLQSGDILIVEGNGSLDHIGRNALFVGNGEEWIHQNHIIRVRLSREVSLPEFVSRFLNSDQGKKQMIEKAKTTSGLYTLSAGKVGSLEVPAPSMAKQQHISAILNEQMASAERARKAIDEELQAVNKLPATLLRRAFSGEL